MPDGLQNERERKGRHGGGCHGSPADTERRVVQVPFLFIVHSTSLDDYHLCSRADKMHGDKCCCSGARESLDL